MSQLSQFSEGALSDIITDVDKFIEENGITEDVGQFLSVNTTETLATIDEEENYKTVPLAQEAPQPTFVYMPPIKQELQFPPEDPRDLGTEEYSGPFNFEVLIIPSEQKTPWEYSAKLKKIFIGINLKFPVAFSLENRPDDVNLFIRATPIFSQAQFFQELVHRCVGHRHPQDGSNKGLPAHTFQHIIRCSNHKTRYFGDTIRDRRLSVVIPLAHPQAGSDLVKEFYQFVCKNSCPQGMNRRPIDVVFTLEDENGEVFGRRLLSVRICSCPKRDKEKEEKDGEKCGPPRGKKRKLGGGGGKKNGENDGVVDTRVYTINVVGRSNFLHVLSVTRDRMAAECLRLEDKNNGDNPFKKSYNELTKVMEKMMAE